MGDVNTDAGFMEELAKAAGHSAEDIAEIAPPSETPDVQRGLEVEAEPAPRRDEHGRFVSQAEPETPEAEEPEAEAQPEAEAEDWTPPTREEWEAAERERQEAQSLIGRQGQELGSVREQLARIEGRLDERSSTSEEAPALPTASAEEVEGIESMLEEHGPDATFAWIGQNRPDLFEAALGVAEDEHPVAAARWAVRYERLLGQQEQEPAAPAAPETHPLLQKLEVQDKMNTVVGESKALLESQGIQWELARKHLLPSFQEAPDLVQNAVLSDDADTRTAGVAALAALAKARVIANVSDEKQATETAASVAKKKAAAVATGSQRPAGKPAAEADAPGDAAARVAAFHEKLLATETTSVADGLTYG